MKLFSKTLARIFGKEAEPEEDVEVTVVKSADLIVFNYGDEKYEFAECGNCGAELERDMDLNNLKLEAGLPYPDWCPKCGSIFDRMIKAEEVE